MDQSHRLHQLSIKTSTLNKNPYAKKKQYSINKNIQRCAIVSSSTFIYASKSAYFFHTLTAVLCTGRTDFISVFTSHAVIILFVDCNTFAYISAYLSMVSLTKLKVDNSNIITLIPD